MMDKEETWRHSAAARVRPSGQRAGGARHSAAASVVAPADCLGWGWWRLALTSSATTSRMFGLAAAWAWGSAARATVVARRTAAIALRQLPRPAALHDFFGRYRH